MTTPGNLPAPTISEIGERGLIERIRRRVPPAPSSLVVGIGDDAAVAQPERGALEVLTTDVLVEGVHFDRRFSTLADVGYKALAVNVSDVASMGGAPRLALLSLILPDTTTADDVDTLIDGFLALASETRVALAGGNISRSPGPLVVDVSLVGSVRPRRVLTRAGGRPGDELYVTGTVGGAAAGLAWLREHGGGSPPPGSGMAECVARYRRPEPRARLGAILGRTRAAGACMDLSDGLADGVRQIAEASGTGASVDAALVPIQDGAREYWSAHGVDPVTEAVAGGDDYELLFTVPKRGRGRLRHVRQHARGVPITCIGQLTPDPAIVLVRDDRASPLPHGFVHFQAGR